jgi:plastocyanin
MKKIYVAILISFTSLMASATIHPVQVLAGSFSPATVNALVGDTIGWTWTGGTHTTTSTTIPVCGVPWDSPISAGNPVWAIVVPCAGTYNYVCTPHGFTGVINVTSTAGIPAVDAANGLPAVSPNPSASGIFNLSFANANTLPERIYIVDPTGKKIMEETFVSTALSRTLNLQSFAKGVYFLVMQTQNQKKVMKLVR